MTAEEYLNNVRAARKRIAALERSAERAFASATGMTAKPSGETAGGPDVSRRPEAYALLTEDIDQEIARLQRERREAFNAINQLRDSRYVAVLVGYYIDGLTWERVAEVNGYSCGHVMHKIRPAALAAFEGVFKEDTKDT